MKRTLLFTLVVIFVALMCASCISVTVVPPATLTPEKFLALTQAIPGGEQTPATPTPEISITLTEAIPGGEQTPATPTPEIFIALTQAIPGMEQTPASAGTTVSYGPLTLTIPHTVASGASESIFPRLDSADAAWWQKTPGHTQINLNDTYILQGKTHQPAIYVYPAQAYAELVPAAFESIRRVNNYLYDPAPLNLDQLPGVPFFNTQMLFAAHIQQVSFQNGSGIRFLTEYAQSPASANNTDLFYNFTGVTRDGAYYIVAIFPISNLLLAETSDAGAPLPSGGVPYPYMADPNANMNTYYIAITDLLNLQLPASFTPSLGDLDTLFQSMQITP